MGADFTLDLLTEASDLDAGTVVAAVDELWRRRIMREYRDGYDDPGVVRALRDDLGRRFGEDFRVTGTSSPAAGRAMLGELADEHVTVVVLIVGHQMREMPGAEFLARAHRIHPRASECSWSSATTPPAARSSRR